MCSEWLDSEIQSTQTASEEAMTVLEEVIMFSFQQCVYYLTKVSVKYIKYSSAHWQYSAIFFVYSPHIDWAFLFYLNFSLHS